MRNVPRVVRVAKAPDWIVCTDASSWGWGYVAIDNNTGEVRNFGAPWTRGFRNLYHDKLRLSTFTEPQAVVNALCHMFSPTQKASVRVVTDNTVTQATFQRGFSSRSFHVNECRRRIEQIFGSSLDFDFVYMAGAWNVSDAWSRGRTEAYAKGERDDVRVIHAQRSGQERRAAERTAASGAGGLPQVSARRSGEKDRRRQANVVRHDEAKESEKEQRKEKAVQCAELFVYLKCMSIYFPVFGGFPENVLSR